MVKEKGRKILAIDRGERIIYTSSGGTSKIFDAAKKISGAGFRFSKASADTIASNLI